MQTTITLVEETCICGVTYAVPQTLSIQAKEQGKWLYCPLGHSYHYIKSEVVKLREQISDLEQQRRQMIENNEKLQRKLSRVEKGCCPHCHRHFRDLARHIQAKHKK